MCAFGIANLQFESNLSEYFRKGNEVSKEVEAFEERYGGSSFLLKVVDSNQPGGVLTPAFVDTLNDLESSLEGFNILSKTSTFANLIESFYSGLPTQVQLNLLRGTIAGTVIQGSVSKDSSRAAIHTYIRNTNARDISRTLVRVGNGLREILPAEFTVTLKGTPPHPRIIQLHMESFSRSQAISLAFSVLVVWSLVSLMFSSLLVGSVAMLPFSLPLRSVWGPWVF